MKKAFTLIELITVLIIVAVLAALALPQFAKMVERARGAEAREGMSVIRKIMMAYYAEQGKMPEASWDNPNYWSTQTGLPFSLGTDCLNPNFYFQYLFVCAPPLCSIYATRCKSSGKEPHYDKYGRINLVVNLSDGTAEPEIVDGPW